MTIEQLTSAIYNNVVSGLKGTTANNTFTTQQIEDAIIQERMQIIKEYSMKNLIPKNDLMLAIRCLVVDCQDIERCQSGCAVLGVKGDSVKHVEIPQIFNDLASDAIGYFGSKDMQLPFTIYTDYTWRYHNNKRRRSDSPFVWIDTTPNSNNMYDAFIFNAPLLTDPTIIAIFKDVRQLANYSCCDNIQADNINFIDTEIEKRLTEKFIRYYRQMATALSPNNQIID